MRALLPIAVASLCSSAALAAVPVMAPPPPRIVLSDQQRYDREQACRSDVQRIFTSDVSRRAYLEAAHRRAASEFRLRAIGEVLSSTVLELRAYVVAMVQVDHLSEGWIASQPGYFQCEFDHEGNVVAIEFI